MENERLVWADLREWRKSSQLPLPPDGQTVLASQGFTKNFNTGGHEAHQAQTIMKIYSYPRPPIPIPYTYRSNSILKYPLTLLSLPSQGEHSMYSPLSE